MNDNFVDSNVFTCERKSDSFSPVLVFEGKTTCVSGAFIKIIHNYIAGITFLVCRIGDGDRALNHEV